MSYISRIKKEFEGLPHSTIWELITNRTYGEYYHLVHPCRTDKKLLAKYLPESHKPEEILPLVQQKKKVLAKKYNIKNFPPDREPGFLGQAALFAVIKENIEDLSYYFHDMESVPDNRWFEGFGLFHTLMGFTQVRRMMGFDDVDILSAIFESRTPSKVIIKLEKIWLYRLFTNISALIPRVTDDEILCEIWKNLVRVQDGWGLTVARIKDWTGLDEKYAKYYRFIVAATGFVHRCRLVSKNTGIVRTLKMNSSLSKEVDAEDYLCRSLGDSENCFVSLNYQRKENAEDFFEFEAYIQNIENYDYASKQWTIRNPKQTVMNKQEIYQLFCGSDLTIPNNDIVPTDRDLLFIALLASMPVEYHPNWKDDVIERLVKGCGISKRNAELGYRNIFRKNMVRHQYTFAISGDRKQLLVLFNDTEKKSLPFLTQVLPGVPVCILRANFELTDGLMVIYYPRNLSSKFENFITNMITETDVNASTYDILEWKHAETSSLLSLIDSRNIQ